jgi:hypothetical protein
MDGSDFSPQPEAAMAATTAAPGTSSGNRRAIAFRSELTAGHGNGGAFGLPVGQA